jgi:hypothetical protein
VAPPIDPVAPVTKTVFLAGEDIWPHPRTGYIQDPAYQIGERSRHSIPATVRWK